MRGSSLRAKNELDQPLNRTMGLHRMAKREFAVNAVNIAPTDSLSLENPACFEFRDDFLNRPLGDSNRGHHIPQSHFRILGKAQKDVGVIGEKRPTRGI